MAVVGINEKEYLARNISHTLEWALDKKKLVCSRSFSCKSFII